jgi:hypothetical protein
MDTNIELLFYNVSDLIGFPQVLQGALVNSFHNNWDNGQLRDILAPNPNG